MLLTHCRFVASFTTDSIHRYSLETGDFLDFFGNEDELDCPEGRCKSPLQPRICSRTLTGSDFVPIRRGQGGGRRTPAATARCGSLLLPASADVRALLMTSLHPAGIEFNERGELLVVSFLGDELVQYTEDGVYMGAVGREHLKGPEDLTVLLNGDVLVTSHYGNEIVRFTDDGAGGYM